MTVKVNWHLLAHPFTDLTNEELRRFRPTNADGIDHDNFLRARLQSRQVNRLEKIEICARAIDGEERDRYARFAGRRNRVTNPAQNFFPGDAVGLQLNFAGRRFDHRATEVQADEFVNIGLYGARESPKLSLDSRLLHQLNRFGIFG